MRFFRLGSSRSAGIICLSSLWSTKQMGRSFPEASGATAPGMSSKKVGISIPAHFSAYMISPFSSFSARAAVPRQSAAAPRAPATESRSVFTWPTNRQPCRIFSTQSCSMKASALGFDTFSWNSSARSRAMALYSAKASWVLLISMRYPSFSMSCSVRFRTLRGLTEGLADSSGVRSSDLAGSCSPGIAFAMPSPSPYRNLSRSSAVTSPSSVAFTEL
mmetsp:Transcript_43211/g.100795  ORF Transcript_43211/g.100795 Transcript_43211/m.100795 type:complete len:218 (-) Transcript_43211:181-834(-)